VNRRDASDKAAMSNSVRQPSAGQIRPANEHLWAERPYSRAIGRRGQAQCTGRQYHDSNCVAEHVKKLDRVRFLGDTSHNMSLDSDTDIAGTEAAFGHIAGQNHVSVQLKRHRSDFWTHGNESRASLPVSIGHMSKNHGFFRSGVVIDPSLSQLTP
jgi:hypothetical protein